MAALRHKLSLAMPLIVTNLIVGSVNIAHAQQDDLTFEQAQTRTAYARRQMESKQRALRHAEAEEKAALQRFDKLRDQLEEARQIADIKTKAREEAERHYSEATEKWSVESQRLRRIHKQQ